MLVGTEEVIEIHQSVQAAVMMSSQIEKEEEEEEESDSDDEPRPKPQNEQKLSGDSSSAEGESNQERREQNDSGTNVQPPVPTTHSDFAVDEINPEPSLNAVDPLVVPAQNQTK